MAYDLRGQVALVTGASSGIGWQAAWELARAGMHVCVTARREEPLQRLAGEIRALGEACLVLPGDLTKEEDVQRIVEGCLAHFGRLDVLVNNASVQAYAPFQAYTEAEIQRVFDVNCIGTLRVSRLVLPHLLAQKSGHIVTISSVLAKGAVPLFSLYSATKHALLGWSETIRHELAGTGVDVSTILMPAVATPLYDHTANKLGIATKPLPPIYPTTLAGRWVRRCVERPRAVMVPSLLQGVLLFAFSRWFPWARDRVLQRLGWRLQLRDQLQPLTEGNLFAPGRDPGGPEGSVKPTPTARRLLGGAALAGGIGGVLAAAGVAVRGLRHALAR